VLVESAGLNPSDEVHPYTIEAMREVGIDLSQHVCKKIDIKVFLSSNAIVKLCKQVVDWCPIAPFNIMNVDWNITDPLGEDGGSLEDVRSARDEIRKKVIGLLKGLDIPVA
jgi:arsenate reductase (thioredoxin)